MIATLHVRLWALFGYDNMSIGMAIAYILFGMYFSLIRRDYGP
jgi:hypothetical protein